MFKDGYNEWSDRYDGKGIDIFNVTVNGGDDKPSSLAGMHSTGNNLREVNVVTNANQTGTFADLTIGNSNTPYPRVHAALFHGKGRRRHPELVQPVRAEGRADVRRQRLQG